MMRFSVIAKNKGTHPIQDAVRRSLGFLGLFMVVGMLQACGKTEEPKREGTASAISGFNYSNEGIQRFYVNGQWGGNLGIGSGYDSICCVTLPNKWTPGLSATIEWKRSDCRDSESRCPKRVEDVGKWPMLYLEKDVPIEPYDRPNSVQVMFLPNDEIKVYVQSMSPDHPDHPSKLGKPRPLDHPEWVR